MRGNVREQKRMRRSGGVGKLVGMRIKEVTGERIERRGLGEGKWVGLRIIVSV